MTVLIDTSAWIDYLRDAESPQADAVERALDDDEVGVTDAVVLEVLAGVVPSSFERHQALLRRGVVLRQRPWIDVTAAAELYQMCRRAGETIRSLNDCLIAAIAIRHDVPVLHRDRDFDAIARHADLQVVSA